MTTISAIELPPSRRILVCGGAGYIGAHMCKRLYSLGHVPICLDNFSTGHRESVRFGPLVEADLLDRDALMRAIADYRVDAVMHFAGLSQVGESVTRPDLYLRNNVMGTINLLDAMVAHGVRELVFSSSAAVYGFPHYTPLDEAHPTHPINPYGQSKRMAEQAIAEYAHAFGMRAIILRYFNAAGADPGGELGEMHNPETHLIPLLIRSCLGSEPASALVYGADYATADGTCERDFVHVEDICDAHLSALSAMPIEPGVMIYNLGSGRTYSVLQVIEECSRLAHRKMDVKVMPRRVGDPPRLIASASKAEAELGWTPQHSLQTCIETAMEWHRRNAGNNSVTAPHPHRSGHQVPTPEMAQHSSSGSSPTHAEGAASRE